MNDQREHWYIVAIKVVDNYVEIWDSLTSGLQSTCDYRVMQVRKMLKELDIVLAEDIAGTIHRNFKFSSLHINVHSSTLKQMNLFDCGVYVCEYMRQFSRDFSKAAAKIVRALTKSRVCSNDDDESTRRTNTVMILISDRIK
ncbi:hypothetical protein ACOSQ2_012827 [Xanthoceras sorbifolium]